ncbi:MAG: hypothetical protein ACR2QW_15495, partial [bacterium]
MKDNKHLSTDKTPSPKVLKLPVHLNLVRRIQFPRKLGILERVYGKFLDGKGTQWVTCSNGIVWKLDLTDP